MARQVQPLWTWWVSIACAAAALAIAYAWGEVAYKGQAGRTLNLGRISQPGAVVLLGDSKSRCAVLFDQDLTAALAARGMSTPFVRIARPGAVFREFDAAFKVFSRTPPRLILIQADFFTLEPFAFRPAGTNGDLDWRRQTRLGLESLVTDDPGYDPGDPHYNLSPEGAAACDTADATPLSQEGYARAMADRRTSTLAERRRLLRQVRLMKARGADVVLLSIPRAPTAERALPPALSQGMREILDEGRREHDLEVLGAPPVIDDSGFLDAGHMTDAGRAAYSAWLADRIAERLARDEAL